MKALKSILATVLILLLAAGIAVGGYAVGKYGIPGITVPGAKCEHTYENGVCTKCGEKEPEQEDQTPELESVSESGMAISKPLAEHPVMNLTATPLTADNEGSELVPAERGYIFEVVLTPSESVLKDFTYTAKFKNELSEWAKPENVSDYLDLTVDETNPLKATVKPLQPYGEPIIITCAYDKDNSIRVSRQLDYIRPVKKLQFNDFTGGKKYEFDADYAVSVNAEYGVGTLQGELQPTEGYAELSDAAVSFIERNDHYQTWYGLVDCPIDGDMSNTEIAGEMTSYNSMRYYYSEDDTSTTEEWFSANFQNFIDWYQREYYLKNLASTCDKYINGAFKQLAMETTNQIRVCLSYTYKFGGVEIDAGKTYSDWKSIDPDSISTTLYEVGDIEFSDGSGPIIFH